MSSKGKHFKHWKQVPEWLWDLCPNFHPRTDPYLVSPDTGEIFFHIPSMIALQTLRDTIGKPIKLLSGYRNPVYNARKGGSPKSYHKLMIAFDIQVYPHDLHVLEDTARMSGFRGVGRYPSRGFLHLDMGPTRTWYGHASDKPYYEGNQRNHAQYIA